MYSPPPSLLKDIFTQTVFKKSNKKTQKKSSEKLFRKTRNPPPPPRPRNNPSLFPDVLKNKHPGWLFRKIRYVITYRHGYLLGWVGGTWTTLVADCGIALRHFCPFWIDTRAKSSPNHVWKNHSLKIHLNEEPIGPWIKMADLDQPSLQESTPWHVIAGNWITNVAAGIQVQCMEYVTTLVTIIIII